MSFDILTQMLRRCLAFALTAVILGAPVATAVCQAMCATTEATTAAHHSCHGDAPATGIALTAPAHSCGHTDQLPPGRDQAREDLASPPAIVPASPILLTVAVVARPALPRPEYSPPLFVSLAAPLRL